MTSPPIEILMETPDLMVINKPAGLLSQPDRSGDPDVAGLLRAQKKLEFLAPVHRLDRNTSGCLILAKSSKAAASLSHAIKKGEIKRTYRAVVKGCPEESGEIDAPLEKNAGENRTFVSDAGKTAITRYRRMEKWGACSLVEVQLATGRSHQIRAHFAHIGCPLIGDKKYAKKPWSEIYSRPALHALSVEYPNPANGQRQIVSCAPPADLNQLVKKLSSGV